LADTHEKSEDSNSESDRFHGADTENETRVER
jgi:hypothetical protein